MVGLAHAAFSFYWALGGRWLLPTDGQWAVNTHGESRWQVCCRSASLR